MLAVVNSSSGASVRLTDERWAHISQEHRELIGWRSRVLETVQTPDRVLEGTLGELLAVRQVEPGKCLVVVYREGDDGFIITAFLTRRLESLERRRQLWP